MLDIKKEYKNGYIVYNFTGTTEIHMLEELKGMLKKDIKHTYMFMFNFKDLDYLSVDAIKMLQKIYIMSVNYACEIGIIGLNKQPEMMFEIFQLDRLYSVKKASNIFHGESYESSYSA
jgi:anti-anti-sigma regulatory factor